MRVVNSRGSLRALEGTTTEGADLDFKGSFEPKKPGNDIEAAKDIAALANTLGGHIVVGASTEFEGTRCNGFQGVDRELATRISQHFEANVKERCRPTPFINVSIIDLDESAKVVVVITVNASPNAPVGVRLRQTEGGKLVDEGWAFPIRVGSQTNYIQPDQFGVYESMTARRAAALLHLIPLADRENCSLRWSKPSDTYTPFDSRRVKLEEVALDQNVARFRDGTDGAVIISVPLDEISTVWKASENPCVWTVSTNGILRPKNGLGTPMEYCPR